AILKEYGVGQGTFSGSTVVNQANPANFTDSDAQALVQKELAAGAIKGGDQTIHTIVLPPGTVLTDGSASSTQGLGGFHGSYNDPATGKPVYYAVIVNSKGSNGIDFTGGNNEDNVSITEGHEWSEAATDPDVAEVNRTGNEKLLGWYDQQYG